MKTSMQQLRENVELSSILSEPTKIIVCAFIDNHIEREKQQIIDAVKSQNGKGFGHTNIIKVSDKRAEYYYNETFKTEQVK